MQKTVVRLINTEALDLLLPPLGCLVLDCPNKVSLLPISSACKPLRLACNAQDGCVQFKGWTLAWYTYTEGSVSQVFLKGQHLPKSHLFAAGRSSGISVYICSHRTKQWIVPQHGKDLTHANEGAPSPVYTMKPSQRSRYFTCNAWLQMHSAYKYKLPHLPSSVQTENIGISVSKSCVGTKNICSPNTFYADWFLHGM